MGFNLSFFFISNNLVVLGVVLLAVSFLTLLERKVLSYIQDRKGPNKVNFIGFVQPLADGIKLILKEILWIYKSNFYVYFFSPFLSMILMLMCWSLYPYSNGMMGFDLGFILLICILSFGVYSFMLSGWASNSIYSLFGSLRSISQTISYEVSLVFLIIIQFFFIKSFKFDNLVEFQESFIFFPLLMSSYFFVFIIILAELNRTPFDLVEGESELVSGFNVEYLSGLFALIFLAEYGMMLFFSLFMSMLFFGCSWILFYLNLFIILWIRGVLPRVRYDKLMEMIWKEVLPLSMVLLLISVSLGSLIDYIF